MYRSAAGLIGLSLLSYFAAGPVAAAEPVSTNEIACSKGGAEACFYAGADYASGGNGLEMSKPKAAELFIKACDLGVPDGCFYTARWYRFGEEGISADPARGIELYETACKMGHEEACQALLSVLGRDEKGEKDIPRLVSAFEEGCANESIKACDWGGKFFYDGWRGENPDVVDGVRGAPLSYKTCKSTGSEFHCPVAENMYANPTSPIFDAERALELTTINCDADAKESCSNLGRIFAIVEDYEMAIGPYEKSCELGDQGSCDYAKDLRRYIDEVAAWNAKQEARRAEMASMLNSGDYNGAVATAVSVYSSTVYAEQAVLATSSAGQMGSVDDYDLKVLEHWFQSGQIGGLVRSEMRRRGLAISGEDNSWARDMQTISSANQRFNAARSNSTYRPIEQAPAPAGNSVSSASATAQVRQKYRDAHCTMNNNANRYLCN